VPNLHDFERRLGGLVEGLFAKTFRSGLQPIEIAKRVLKEMEARRTVGVSEVWAPNHFEITMSEVDAGRFEQVEAALVAELKQVVRDNAAERGWGLVGPPEIELAKDPSMKKGDLDCVASLVEGEDRVEPVRPASRASILIREDGTERSIELALELTTIGRLPNCDIVLKDKGASRQHAQIREKDGAYTLTDLGSTNGTQLNGQTVQTRQLRDGDRITIGSTTLDFRSG
jgi:hypothetical protein